MADPVTAHDTISAEQLAATVELACRAPSLHNSQPWRWVFDAGTLHLFADHARVGRHTDSTGREVILGCGAVLDHLEVAAAAAGWRVTVVRYPNPHDHDHLAWATFHPAESVGEHERLLGEAISRRRTDRLAFAAPQPWRELELPWQFFTALVALTVAYLLLLEVTKTMFYAEPMRLAGQSHRTRGREHRVHRRAARFSHPGWLPSPALPA